MMSHAAGSHPSDPETTMTTVETALGSLATAQLGPTLMHEHIVTRSPGVHENWPHLFERNAILEMAQQKLADLHTRGIRTIVDLTTVDLGRDIDLIADVARRSPVQVIVATHISDDILPALRAAGVTTDQIDQMLIGNPRAIFEAVG